MLYRQFQQLGGKILHCSGKPQYLLCCGGFFYAKRNFNEKYRTKFLKLRNALRLAYKELSSLSEVSPRYFEPEISANAVLWKLTAGDISKVPLAFNMEVGFCYDWYYAVLVKELNKMRFRIAEIKRMRMNA